MQPILSTDNNTQQITNARPEINGFKTKKPVINEEKIVLPVEMASMVPLKTLIGKMIYKSHADLMTLTDTLPSMSDVEKKRQILNYATFVRKQFLKLLVLVKWAKNARDIQMCQNIMAFLANQNQIFQITTDYLHKIHVELPAARLREFDIDTAVDVLSTGTYQQMPSKTKDLFAVTPLSDAAVLETFQNMNDLIRMRMLTTEVLPLPMQHYRIENGRIYLKIENEFEVTLTLTGQGEDKKWWIVSLDIFVEATEGNGGEDVDFALNDKQKQHLRMNAQKQLTPPDDSDKHKFMFFPLVNLYDYLHLCCLNMQLEILYIQSAILSKTRWINQLKVQMDADRSKLTLIYWGGESAVSKWARPHSKCDEKKSTTVEISINNEQEKQTKDMNITVRDEFKGLIQKAGIGASVALSDISLSDRTKVITSLKYPKNDLEIVWGGSNDLYTTRKLLDPLQLNVEKLVQHITNYHGKHIIDKFRTLLESQKEFLEENGLYLAEENIEVDKDTFRRPTLIIRYRHQKYVSIETDARTGRVKASEASDGCSEGDVILRSLEERLQTDPANIARHLIWLRSEVVIREVISLAKQLNLQSYHPSQINLRPDDIIKLFGDSSLKPEEKAKTSLPPHCVFLQFPQFEEWYFVIAIIKNEFRSCLCCLNKIYDQSNLYQGIVDVIYIDCDQMWRDQFMPSETVTATNKRRLSCTAEHTPALKRRKTSAIEQMTAVDNLSMDLRYLAKLDSICRAYITNRKIESQLQSYKGYLTYHMRPLLKSLSTMETHVISHPAADKMEVICVSQKDLLKTCAYNQSKNTAKTPIETIPWIEGQLKNMKNDILIRSCGWWESGHRECYAVIQDKLDWKNIPLQSSEFGDHISLDKATSIISFTYTNLDTCISQFLSDWESIFMMVNIARQVPSIWLKKYRDQLQFRPTNLKQLTFSYAKHFTCTIKWVIRDKGRPNQYDIELAMLDDNSKAKSTSLPLNNMRNPHWRISTFLKDALNEKRDLIDFIQILFQTLPLMACLERLEMESVQQGDVGKITIIPRSYDSVRVIFSATHAIDIRFTDPSTLCVSDAAYHHIFYSSHAKSKPDTFVAPRPYIVSPSPSPHENTTMKPIRVAQQFKFAPFLQFTGLLATLENWIFPEEGDLDEYSIESNEPTAVPFQHGLLCSASLCQGLLDKLQALV